MDTHAQVRDGKVPDEVARGVDDADTGVAMLGAQLQRCRHLDCTECKIGCNGTETCTLLVYGDRLVIHDVINVLRVHRCIELVGVVNHEANDVHLAVS